MSNIETLEVTVKYRVGLRDLNVPEKVREQLLAAEQDGKALGSDTQLDKRYDEATTWLMDNIRERDCKDWECELDDLTLPE